MSTTATIQQINRDLATRINEETRKDPQHSPYKNKFVGIANGQVVVVADDGEEMSERLRQIEPDPSKCFGVEASRDYSVVEEIWRLRRCRESDGLFGVVDLAFKWSSFWWQAASPLLELCSLTRAPALELQLLKSYSTKTIVCSAAVLLSRS